MMFFAFAFLAGLLPPTDSVVLSNRCGSAEIALVGAQVVSYRPTGQDEVLFFPADRDFSRDREMHGGIPVCWPWFGRFGEPGSRMHGLARYERWQVVERTQNENSDRVVLELVSTAKTRTIWPHDFKLRYTIDLGSQLALTLEATNTGCEPFSVTTGFHPYFRVADPEKIRIFGLPEPVSVFPGIDKGYYTPPNGSYRFDTGFSLIGLTAKGECRLVVWNPGPEWPDWKPDCNLGREDWRHFVCVEPTVTRKERAVLIKAGDSHSVSLFIKTEAKE